MSETIARLQMLHRQLARRRKLQMMLEDLRAQLTELEDETAFLQEAYLSGQDDTQRREGESFSALLGRLLRRGGGEGELCAAAMKYETAQRQLADVQGHIAALLRENEQYTEAEAAFAAAFRQRRQRLAQEEPQRAAELLAVEQRVAAAEAELHEVEEALVAGQRVLAAMENAERRLSGAEGWGGIDLLQSGAEAVAAAFAGQDRTTPAEDGVYAIQELLRSYRTELADVSLEAGLRVKVDGFLRFSADFFDELFGSGSAWELVCAVERHLADAGEQVRAVQEQLAASQKAYDAELARLRAQRAALTLR